jgi:hypothetical protein
MAPRRLSELGHPRAPGLYDAEVMQAERTAMFFFEGSLGGKDLLDRWGALGGPALRWLFEGGDREHGEVKEGPIVRRVYVVANSLAVAVRTATPRPCHCRSREMSCGLHRYDRHAECICSAAPKLWQILSLGVDYLALVEIEMLLLSLNVALFLSAFIYLRWSQPSLVRRPCCTSPYLIAASADCPPWKTSPGHTCADFVHACVAWITTASTIPYSRWAWNRCRDVGLPCRYLCGQLSSWCDGLRQWRAKARDACRNRCVWYWDPAAPCGVMGLADVTPAGCGVSGDGGRLADARAAGLPLLW